MNVGERDLTDVYNMFYKHMHSNPCFCTDKILLDASYREIHGGGRRVLGSSSLVWKGLS